MSNQVGVEKVIKERRGVVVHGANGEVKMGCVGREWEDRRKMGRYGVKLHCGKEDT